MSARAQRKASEEIVEPWPRGISREPELSIGQLVERLKAEFPAITQSKVRFLEDKGLVSLHVLLLGIESIPKLILNVSVTFWLLSAIPFRLLM